MNSVLAKDIVRDYTASYASYVATSRAIPSVVDGLKPVQRRCINSADDLKIYHDKKFLKVAKLEGQVMGDYHPHGGASMTILAQPFKTRYPLFEGQGNFGCPDNPNSVAASRYIETRLTEFCEKFYLTSAPYADREDNYDGRLKEVVQYYPPIPGSLLTGASNMAVGLSTNIPSHKISEVCKSLLDYIKNPKSDKYMKDLMPETCEESVILTSKNDLMDLYLKGECSVQYKAKTHYEKIDGKLALVVDAFPPDYSKKRLETSYILDAVDSGLLELRNESSTNIRYVFISPDKNILDAIEERLVSSSSYRMYMDHHGCIQCYNLGDLYSDFLEDRVGYIKRKYTDLYEKVTAEEEYLRVWLEFKKDKDYIRTLFDRKKQEVIDHIIKKYNTTENVAVRILSTSISSMMKDGDEEKITQKRAELLALSEEYKSYLDDPMSRITLDIKELYEEYKKEPRRAIHVEDVKDTIDIKYDGKTITMKPSDTIYVATTSNQYNLCHAEEVAHMNLKDHFLVMPGFKYYVFYDHQGLTVVSGETMERLDNKFRSDKLCGIIGTNDLTQIAIKRSNSNRLTKLHDGWVKSRVSYSQQVEGSDTIEIIDSSTL